MVYLYPFNNSFRNKYPLYSTFEMYIYIFLHPTFLFLCDLTLWPDLSNVEISIIGTFRRDVEHDRLKGNLYKFDLAVPG